MELEEMSLQQAQEAISLLEEDLAALVKAGTAGDAEWHATQEALAAIAALAPEALTEAHLLEERQLRAKAQKLEKAAVDHRLKVRVAEDDLRAARADLRVVERREREAGAKADAAAVAALVVEHALALQQRIREHQALVGRRTATAFTATPLPLPEMLAALAEWLKGEVERDRLRQLDLSNALSLEASRRAELEAQRRLEEQQASAQDLRRRMRGGPFDDEVVGVDR